MGGFGKYPAGCQEMNAVVTTAGSYQCICPMIQDQGRNTCTCFSDLVFYPSCLSGGASHDQLSLNGKFSSSSTLAATEQRTCAGQTSSERRRDRCDFQKTDNREQFCLGWALFHGFFKTTKQSSTKGWVNALSLFWRQLIIISEQQQQQHTYSFSHCLVGQD